MLKVLQWKILYHMLFSVGSSQLLPREDAGGLSREYVLRIPSVSLKATKWGIVSESPYIKGGTVSM